MIKKVFFTLALTLLTTQASASTLKCNTHDAMTLVADYVDAGCQGEDGRSYRLKMRGAGISVAFQDTSVIFLECPNAVDLAGTYMGVKVNAAFMAGIKLGVVVAANGRTCLLGGADLSGIGAGITINKLTITQGGY